MYIYIYIYINCLILFIGFFCILYLVVSYYDIFVVFHKVLLKALFSFAFEISKIFFFKESFNLWRLLLIIALYHQTKTPISFWCRRGLNPKSLIQPSETLLIKLTGTHIHYSNLLTLTKKKSQTIAKYILVFSIFFSWN